MFTVLGLVTLTHFTRQ